MGQSLATPCGACCKEAGADLTIYEMTGQGRSQKYLLSEVVSVPALTGEHEGLMRIVLDRTKGDRLGIDVDVEGDVLAIVGLGDGLIDAWNEKHPTLNVKLGDYIVQVNSVGSDADRLIEECKKRDVLELLIEPSPELAFQTCDRYGMCTASCVSGVPSLIGVS